MQRRRRPNEPPAAVSTASAELDVAVNLERVIEERERDLELAARLGRQLLDENQELQQRNQFLEESLTARNDAIQQLQFQLQRRSDLLDAYAEYDDQLHGGAAESGHPIGFVVDLQARVQQLEAENGQLKSETTRLRDAVEQNEQQQEERIKDYLSQLERANLKIARLQSQISERTRECEKQNEEIQRLLKEIGARKQKEKSMSKENDDLQLELNAAVRNHEELSAEILGLQERYGEVVEMLNEAQGELRTARHNPDLSAHSLSSLYDSLQSELEASDSGFHSTPLPSGRVDLPQREAGPSSELLRLDLGALNDGAPSTSSPARIDYDLPSQVIVDAVRRSLSSERKRLKRAASSASHSPRDFAELVDERPRNQLPTVDELPIDGLKEEERQHRDVSCSPIRVESPLRERPPDEPTPRAPTASTFFPYSGATSFAPATTASEAASSSAPTSDEDEETPRSSDSLRDYVGPALGQPGVLGTRDLEYSLKKLDIRKQIEREYETFRKRRGLGRSTTPLYSGRTKRKQTPNKLAPVALNARLLADTHRSASLDRPASGIEERKGGGPTPPTRPQLPSDALRVNRPRMFRSPSAGFQLLKCAEQGGTRGIDSVVRDRVPFVCGVLWRSLMQSASSTFTSTSTNLSALTIQQPQPKTAPEKSELCRQIMANTMIMNSLGVSPVRNRAGVVELSDFMQLNTTDERPHFIRSKIPPTANGGGVLIKSRRS